ncbi:putative baseplate assembly protein [Ferribacterium limneticum]|uniref:putative baseplate assembly protein n=1 Tax=Ferribacterium limneticum TaxID=76259 RepID=UPI001CF7F5A2|nr:putative baseplate assembly protein [Ferribacterium limneticum]UCV21124.1 putative baseplate assembly protein [Ferribacterium limneticum]
MNRQFRSDNPRRLQLLRDQNPVGKNGIDFVEITSLDQRSLRVVCVHPVSAISRANVRIEGGVRITGIALSAEPVINGREIRLKVEQAGDFSWYTLSLIDPADAEAPAPGFDICLSTIRINFKAGCPSEFDCADLHDCPPDTPPEPRLDYLAKDYDSFRRLMLDRMSQLIPGFAERSPADFTVALVETLAYVGDHLSYTQDAAATEAYLGTARRRTSLRRHARLLDYPLHDGCNARVFVTATVDADAEAKTIPAGTALLAAAGAGDPVRRTDLLDQLPLPGIEVFETLHDQVLHAAHSEIAIHDFADPAYCLPRGTTAAALVNSPALALAAGDVLIFEEILSPTTGKVADLDASHRHPVRLTAVSPGHDDLTNTDLLLINWHNEDALPFPLCVSHEFEIGGALVKQAIAVARGNVVLADHGLTRPWQTLEPPEVGDGGTPALRLPYRPRLRESGLAFAEPYDHDVATNDQLPLSASRVLSQEPRNARPADMMLLADDSSLFGDQPDPNETPWTPQRDLLGSERFAREFVVETENDGSAWLRFGDNQFGAAPITGQRLLARYRLGGGPRGNVGAEAISALVSDDANLMLGIQSLRNPLPATGGAEPETLDAIRLNAPEAFRTQERAVTTDDYARAAERHPDVQRAAARLRWTGSWYTVFLMLDRREGKPVDAAFKATMRAFLERFRLAGYDFEFADPVHVPLDIQLQICVASGYFAADIKAALLEAFTAGVDRHGRPGFFHPDGFTFGTPLYLSAVVARAMAVAGVASVDIRRFQRWGRSAKGELAAGVITADQLEVLRADGDLNFPENGQISFIVEGGS